MSAGFTILELLIVVLVIALIAAFSAPSVHSVIETAQIRGTVDKLTLISYAAERERLAGRTHPAGTAYASIAATYPSLGSISSNDWGYAYTIEVGPQRAIARTLVPVADLDPLGATSSIDPAGSILSVTAPRIASTQRATNVLVYQEVTP